MKVATLISYGNQDKIAEVRPRHREYLGALKEQGKLAMAGPFEDDSGALIVYDVANLDEARQILEADPFNAAGIFQEYTMKPWRQVF